MSKPLEKNIQKKIAVIGAGFAGISAAAYLAKEGYLVDVYEKNEELGGRARQLRTTNGYTFDMGPSWYWMPEVFERFFADFGYRTSDFYKLQQLDPGFRIVYGQGDELDVPADGGQLRDLFESIEPGSAQKLDDFLAEAAYKYEIGMGKLVYKPGISIREFFDLDLFKGILRMQVFTSFSKHVRKHFKNHKIIALMEFPILFLGAMPKQTPALYSLMNYAGLKLGTWYTRGGFASVIDAMKSVAENQGVTFHAASPVNAIEVRYQKVIGLKIKDRVEAYDGVVASADYHHVESMLLKEDERNYGESYWDKKTLAPSSLIFYLGVKHKLKNLQHHTLFFDEDLDQHAKEIYQEPKWPQKPLFYVCCPSITDDSLAPQGHENLFILMPLAPGLEDTEELRTTYFDLIIDRLEKFTGNSIRPHLDFKKSYCINDFVNDYHAYKGNAYGLANTLMQTANLKPSINNKKLTNLYYAGQLTVPGPGVPPSIISGKLAANQLITYLNEQQ